MKNAQLLRNPLIRPKASDKKRELTRVKAMFSRDTTIQIHDKTSPNYSNTR